MISGRFGDGARDAKALLLAAGKAEGAVVQAVLSFLPERRAARLRSTVSSRRACHFAPARASG